MRSNCRCMQDTKPSPKGDKEYFEDTHIPRRAGAAYFSTADAARKVLKATMNSAVYVWPSCIRHKAVAIDLNPARAPRGRERVSAKLTRTKLINEVLFCFSSRRCSKEGYEQKHGSIEADEPNTKARDFLNTDWPERGVPDPQSRISSRPNEWRAGDREAGRIV